MQRGERKWGRGLLLAVAAAAMLAMLGAQPAALDIAVTRDGASALLRVGFASVRIAFDSGQECSKPDKCSGGLAPRLLSGAVARAAGTAIARL